MKHYIASLILLTSGIALSGPVNAEPPPSSDASSGLNVARRNGWQLAMLVVDMLEKDDQKNFPGIQAWLKDFRRLTKGIDLQTPPEKWPALDIDTLVTRNPNFWQAYYEIAPGDPGLVMLHAGLLLSGGEANRATYIVAIAKQRQGIPKAMQTAYDLLLANANKAGQASNAVVAEGIKLHDQGDYTGALKKYQEAIALWPQNGFAHYEMGYTIFTEKLVKAGEKPPLPGTAKVGGNVKHPAETVAAYARARRHDPFQIMAYQGDDQEVIRGFVALAKRGKPVWDKIAKAPDTKLEDKALADLADACQAANIHDLALVARQIVVARRARYDPADHPFISASLGKLAPGPGTAAALKRLAGNQLEARQLVIPDAEFKLYEPKQPAPTAKPGAAFHWDSVLLYQAQDLLSKRLGEDVTPFADYVKKLDEAASAFWATQPKGHPQSLFIIIMIKPGSKAQFWFTRSETDIKPEVLPNLRKKLAEVTAPDVADGSVAMAMCCSLWGAAPVTDAQHPKPPDHLMFPKEWTEAAKKRGVDLKIPLSDEVLNLFWKD